MIVVSHEDDYWNGRVPTHGRLIDADALIDKLPQEYLGSTIHLLINDAPTVQADRPHGEWIDVNLDGSLWRCDQCKDTACCDGNFCPQLRCGYEEKTKCIKSNRCV